MPFYLIELKLQNKLDPHFKIRLHQHCIDIVEQQLDGIIDALKDAQDGANNETKSSAGDKHETGRAMLQLEMEKASQQLASVQQMKVVLNKLSIGKTSKVSCLGSVVLTNKATYYLAISAGKITVKNIDYFAVSINSPIGKQLLGSSVGDVIAFNGTKIIEIY